MKTYRTIAFLWFCLTACTAVWAQDYLDRFHYSTVYYINVQDAKGKSMVNDMIETAIQAYVGDELRGVSTRWTTNAQTGQNVLVVRVWGQEGDPAEVSFCAYYGEKDMEVGYHLGTLDFHGGVDESVGTPAKPIGMKLVPISDIQIVPSSISVKVDETTYASYKFLPENHNEIEPQHNEAVQQNYDVWYGSSNTSVFTVGLTTGLITGKQVGEAMLEAGLVYASEKNGELYFTYLFKTSTIVTVVTDDIPVEGIRNNMHTLQIEREVEEYFELDFTLLPEYATNRKVTYEVGNEDIVKYTVDEKGIATFWGVQTGRTTITVISDDNPSVQLTYQVSIVDTNMAGHVTKIVPLVNEIDALVGDEITSQLKYTVFPDYAVDKRVTFKALNTYGGTVLEEQKDGTVKAVESGNALIEIHSVEQPLIMCTVLVCVFEKNEANRFTVPDEVTLSKFHEVMVSLNTEPSNATVDPKQLVFTFEDSENAGWGPVATATAASGTGRNWLMQGHYAGDFTCNVTYGGKPVETKSGRSQMIVHIPADYVLHDGWLWMSLYAVPSDGTLPLKDYGDWVDGLSASDYSKVYEIRTQQSFMHYDFDKGYFGPLTKLRPEDGCFKVKVECEDIDDGKLLLSAGTDLKKSTSMSLPQTHTGYTWMTYPHEIDHTLKTLAPYLKKTASEGDMIIAQDDFIEYSGGEWTGTEGFTFHAGEGYIYYTEDDKAKDIYWGPAGLAPEPATTRSLSQSRRAALSRRHPDNMPMVITLDGLASVDDYAIEACVNGERRALSTLADDGLLHLSVAGTSGEEVSLRLINKFTGQSTDLSCSLPFGNKAGNHRAPLSLGAVQSVALATQQTRQTYDLQGRPLGQIKLSKGVYIMNGKKIIK